MEQSLKGNKQLELTKETVKQLKPYRLSPEDCLREFGVTLEAGLDSDDAQKRLDFFGMNELSEREEESLFAKLVEQFEDPMVRLLLLAAVISFAISLFSQGSNSKENDLPIWIEPLVIFLILIGNALVGLYQDYNAEKSVQMLKSLQASKCLVMRDGNWSELEAKLLVPGDIVKLSVGEGIPADCRVCKILSGDFRVNQSVQTGESDEKAKYVEPIAIDCEIRERTNMVYSGTTITSGHCLAIVVRTGDSTELGSVKREVEEAAEEKKGEQSPLKKQLNIFGEQLAKIIGALCLAIWLICLPRFFDGSHGNFVLSALYYFKQAVALGVAAIPEGLPAVITTCLALGTRRMVKRNALVRRLSKVETLGCTTVICTDKTGTITKNEMFASCLGVPGPKGSLSYVYATGDSYSPIGTIKLDEEVNSSLLSLRYSALIGVLNTESKIIKEGKSYKLRGSPTEGALMAIGGKLGQFLNIHTENWESLYVFGFTSFRKVMSVIVHEREAQRTTLLTKGSAEFVLNRCSTYLGHDNQVRPIDSKFRDHVREQINKQASMGGRVIGYAIKRDLGELEGLKTTEDLMNPKYRGLLYPPQYEVIEKDLTFISIVVISDPPRDEVRDSIELCSKAGIVVFMITGDSPETALSIAKKVGMVSHHQVYDSKMKHDSLERVVFVPEDIKALEEKSLFDKILKSAITRKQSLIFSKTDPDHKRMIVRHLTRMDEIVAMTGDGVNDAAALMQSSIGISMGLSGTEVAKEASDIILIDDNFSSIVSAIEEGRSIYANMKAFIRYMISSNIGEVVSIFLTALLGIPEGFTSIQLLWVNLVTDGLPATALSFNPPDTDIMYKPPRKSTDRIINKWTLIRYLVIGTYVGIATVGIFVYYYTAYYWAGDGHSIIDYSLLRNWTRCTEWKNTKFNNHTDPCDYFNEGKRKASALSLTVLVIIEMLNALNATTENESLWKFGFFRNLWLWQAIFISVFMHFLILYIPYLASLFGTAPLSANDWLLVVAFSLPVILIEETLKFYSRKQLKIDSHIKKHK